jgi:hypothetical protein
MLLFQKTMILIRDYIKLIISIIIEEKLIKNCIEYLFEQII